MAFIGDSVQTTHAWAQPKRVHPKLWRSCVLSFLQSPPDDSARAVSTLWSMSLHEANEEIKPRGD